MSKQILSEEFSRMQKLAGIITEDAETPNNITVRFYSDKFIEQYWEGTTGEKVYQAHGFASNLKDLEGEGHSSYGEGGLEMRKGSYYPLFKVFPKEYDELDTPEGNRNRKIKNSIWYYIVYSGDEINIIQSSEHSDQGADISNSFNTLKNITDNTYCKFEEGVKPGAIDHRGFFKIISVK